MDKLSKLKALLPELQVATTEEDSPWTHYPKPKHLYEGTDSEDDEEIMRQGKMLQPQPVQSHCTLPGAETRGEAEMALLASEVTDTGAASITHGKPPPELIKYKLEMGQLGAVGEVFCPWQLIRKYPYTYIGLANRNTVRITLLHQ